jgi:hypothetical protein
MKTPAYGTVIIGSTFQYGQPAQWGIAMFSDRLTLCTKQNYFSAGKVRSSADIEADKANANRLHQKIMKLSFQHKRLQKEGEAAGITSKQINDESMKFWKALKPFLNCKISSDETCMPEDCSIKIIRFDGIRCLAGFGGSTAYKEEFLQRHSCKHRQMVLKPDDFFQEIAICMASQDFNEMIDFENDSEIFSGIQDFGLGKVLLGLSSHFAARARKVQCEKSNDGTKCVHSHSFDLVPGMFTIIIDHQHALLKETWKRLRSAYSTDFRKYFSIALNMTGAKSPSPPIYILEEQCEPIVVIGYSKVVRETLYSHFFAPGILQVLCFVDFKAATNALLESSYQAVQKAFKGQKTFSFKGQALALVNCFDHLAINGSIHGFVGSAEFFEECARDTRFEISCLCRKKIAKSISKDQNYRWEDPLLDISFTRY